MAASKKTTSTRTKALGHRPTVNVRKKAKVSTVASRMKANKKGESQARRMARASKTPEPRVDFAAAVLKGLIEHRDAGTYFGATGALHTWRTIARERGWVAEGDAVTEAGRQHYAASGLEALPKIPNRRAYLWDWSNYVEAPPPARDEAPSAPSDINTLSVGARLYIDGGQGGIFRVTCVDRHVGEDGPLVELRRASSPKTLYTLMRHARQPGTFVLSSSRTSKDVDGWQIVEPQEQK